MKRNDMVITIRDFLIDNQGVIYYADTDALKDIADRFLSTMEGAGMMPPEIVSSVWLRSEQDYARVNEWEDE